MDPITTSIVIILGKYALDKGGELVKEVGPKALDTAKEIFAKAMERLRKDPKDAVVADEFAKDPETYEKPMEKELDAKLKKDAALEGELRALLQQYEQQVEAFGSQPGGQRHVQARGAGVAVGGNVTGSTIITGSNNVVGDKKD